jgi:hypothetical protein
MPHLLVSHPPAYQANPALRWKGWPGPRPGRDPGQEPTVPTPPERRHSIAEVLALVDDLRRLAYDRSLQPDDAMRRIRDRFGEHDGLFDDE